MLKGIIIDTDCLPFTICQESLSLLPYAKEFIKDMYDHGVAIGFIAKSSNTECEDFIKQLNIHTYVHKIQSRNGKATLDEFVQMCSNLKISPKQCILLSDTTEGISACKNSPITVVGYVNPHLTNEDLSSAYMLIEGFEEVDFDFINTIYLHSHGKPVTITTTKRCVIRELTDFDIPILYEFYQDPEHTTYLNVDIGPLEEELDKHKAYRKHSYEFYGFGLWGVFLKDTDRLIGHCGIECKLVGDTPEMELGYLIHKDYQNQGYATECCKAILQYCSLTLDMPRIVAVIDPQNLSSIQVTKRLGMTYEKQILRDQKLCHVYVSTNKLHA